MSSFSLLSLPSSHPLLIKFSLSLFLAHPMPSKAAVSCGWGMVSSNRMGPGLASYPRSASTSFSTGVDGKPHQNLAALEPRSCALWVFGREAAVTICQLNGFAFEIDCKACSDRKELSGEVLGSQDSEYLPLIWIAMQSSEMSRFYNSKGEIIASFGYN